jgi:hypothetical protein
MNRKLHARLAALAFLLIFSATRGAGAQTGQAPPAQPFSFRQGQSVYIVAFTRSLINVGADSEGNGGYLKDYFDFQLDAEKKVRNEFEKWRYFRVADKPSEADFVFLVSYHYSTMEGLAIFKEKFDLDALRESAYGRAISGPLKLPTLSRLSSRLIKDFRQKFPGLKTKAR